MIEALFFYLFSAVMLGAGAMVVISRNPVYSVLFLILAFFNAAGLFVLTGLNSSPCCWLSFMSARWRCCSRLVVMMLDINFAEMRAGFQKYCAGAGGWRHSGVRAGGCDLWRCL